MKSIQEGIEVGRMAVIPPHMFKGFEQHHRFTHAVCL